MSNIICNGEMQCFGFFLKNHVNHVILDISFFYVNGGSWMMTLCFHYIFHPFLLLLFKS